jgi:mono/diheme cytochrome c family protein
LPFIGRAAHYSTVLGLIFAFLTILMGIVDWQYFYAGAWPFPIKMKFILAPVLLILYFLGVWYGRTETMVSHISRKYLAVTILTFFAVVFLGLYGGQLVFSEAPPVTSPELRAGRILFVTRCGACHPQGGNIMNPSLPIKGAPELKNFQTFLDWIRNPVRPGGERGLMPSFLPSRISGQKAKELYSFLTEVIERPREGSASGGPERKP